VDRHTRQIRLAGVGAEGQGRIARAEVAVPGLGLSAEVAARYLAGAGVARIRVQDGRAAAAARAVDPGVQVERVEGTGQAMAEAPTELEDPVARELAAGALHALSALRAALGQPALPTEAR